MPSFAPKKVAPVYPVVDLDFAFRSDETAASRERAVRYIGHFFDTMSNLPESVRDHPFAVSEEFDLLIPTTQAYLDELAMSQGIIDHAAGRIADPDMKALLDIYVASHTYVYSGGVRLVKRGDWESWADTEFVYLRCPTEPFIAFTCTRVQMFLIKLLNPDTFFEVTEI